MGNCSSHHEYDDQNLWEYTDDDYEIAKAHIVHILQRSKRSKTYINPLYTYRNYYTPLGASLQHRKPNIKITRLYIDSGSDIDKVYINPINNIEYSLFHILKYDTREYIRLIEEKLLQKDNTTHYIYELEDRCNKSLIQNTILVSSAIERGCIRYALCLLDLGILAGDPYPALSHKIRDNNTANMHRDLFRALNAHFPGLINSLTSTLQMTPLCEAVYLGCSTAYISLLLHYKANIYNNNNSKNMLYDQTDNENCSNMPINPDISPSYEILQSNTVLHFEHSGKYVGLWKNYIDKSINIYMPMFSHRNSLGDTPLESIPYDDKYQFGLYLFQRDETRETSNVFYDPKIFHYSHNSLIMYTQMVHPHILTQYNEQSLSYINTLCSNTFSHYISKRLLYHIDNDNTFLLHKYKNGDNIFHMMAKCSNIALFKFCIKQKLPYMCEALHLYNDNNEHFIDTALRLGSYNFIISCISLRIDLTTRPSSSSSSSSTSSTSSTSYFGGSSFIHSIISHTLDFIRNNYNNTNSMSMDNQFDHHYCLASSPLSHTHHQQQEQKQQPQQQLPPSSSYSSKVSRSKPSSYSSKIIRFFLEFPLVTPRISYKDRPQPMRQLQQRNKQQESQHKQPESNFSSHQHDDRLSYNEILHYFNKDDDCDDECNIADDNDDDTDQDGDGNANIAIKSDIDDVSTLPTFVLTIDDQSLIRQSLENTNKIDQNRHNIPTTSTISAVMVTPHSNMQLSLPSRPYQQIHNNNDDAQSNFDQDNTLDNNNNNGNVRSHFDHDDAALVSHTSFSSNESTTSHTASHTYDDHYGNHSTESNHNAPMTTTMATSTTTTATSTTTTAATTPPTSTTTTSTCTTTTTTTDNATTTAMAITTTMAITPNIDNNLIQIRSRLKNNPIHNDNIDKTIPYIKTSSFYPLIPRTSFLYKDEYYNYFNPRYIDVNDCMIDAQRIASHSPPETFEDDTYDTANPIIESGELETQQDLRDAWHVHLIPFPDCKQLSRFMNRALLYSLDNTNTTPLIRVLEELGRLHTFTSLHPLVTFLSPFCGSLECIPHIYTFMRLYHKSYMSLSYKYNNNNYINPYYNIKYNDVDNITNILSVMPLSHCNRCDPLYTYLENVYTIRICSLLHIDELPDITLSKYNNFIMREYSLTSQYIDKEQGDNVISLHNSNTIYISDDLSTVCTVMNNNNTINNNNNSTIKDNNNTINNNKTIKTSKLSLYNDESFVLYYASDNIPLL